jgi:hypothetical protein
MEDFSRKIYTPLIGNLTYQTRWFFERARGQYEQPKMQMTKSQREAFDRINPPSQRIKKTDLAKYINSADMKPYDVAWGAEVNAVQFQAEMEVQWEKNNAYYNETFYRDLIAKAILFKTIEKTISGLDWYQENKAYRAQLVTYTFAKFVYEVKKAGIAFNYKYIWDKQEVPNFLITDISLIAKLAFDVFYDPDRPNTNIEVYCKRKPCWEALCQKPYSLSQQALDFMLDKQEIHSEQSDAKKDQRLTNELNLEIDIFNVGAEKWEAAMQNGLKQHIINMDDAKTLDLAINYCNGLTSLTKTNCKKIWVVKEKLEEFSISLDKL